MSREVFVPPARLNEAVARFDMPWEASERAGEGDALSSQPALCVMQILRCWRFSFCL